MKKTNYLAITISISLALLMTLTGIKFTIAHIAEEHINTIIDNFNAKQSNLTVTHQGVAFNLLSRNITINHLEATENNNKVAKLKIPEVTISYYQEHTDFGNMPISLNLNAKRLQVWLGDYELYMNALPPADRELYKALTDRIDGQAYVSLDAFYHYYYDIENGKIYLRSQVDMPNIGSLSTGVALAGLPKEKTPEMTLLVDALSAASEPNSLATLLQATKGAGLTGFDTTFNDKGILDLVALRLMDEASFRAELDNLGYALTVESAHKHILSTISDPQIKSRLLAMVEPLGLDDVIYDEIVNALHQEHVHFTLTGRSLTKIGPMDAFTVISGQNPGYLKSQISFDVTSHP